MFTGKMMKSLAGVAAVGAVALGLGGTSASAETTLRVGSWLPPVHPIVKGMIDPWSKMVEKATEGRVKVKVLKAKLGKPPAYFDIAKDGIADVTYGVHGYTPGRFVLTQAAELPFLADNAEALSVAYWDVYESMMAQANEHKGTKVLGIFTHGPGQIYNSKKAVTTADGAANLKMRIGGGIVHQVATTLNMVPVQAPAPKVYELLSNGVADGILFPKESPSFFKIDKVLKHGTFVKGGLYNTSFFLVMNPKKFASLSEADQKALMSVSGRAFSVLAGKAWDAADQRGVDGMKAAGMQLIDADDAMMGDLTKRLAHIEADWIKRAAEKGADGAAIMKALRAKVADYKM